MRTSPLSVRDLLLGMESLLHVEEASRSRGLLQQVNPLIRMATLVALIFSSLFASSLVQLLPLAAILPLLALLSNVKLPQYLVRSTVFLPVFAGIIALPVIFITPGKELLTTSLGVFYLAATVEGLVRFAVFVTRVWLCIAALNLITEVTGLDGILRLLDSLRVPAIFLHLLSLTYRYIFLSIHEASRMVLAREARTFRRGRLISLRELRSLAGIVSSLFVRTYDRSERVYLAMKARGFSIEGSRSPIPTRVKLLDLAFLFSVSVLIIISFSI